MSSKGTLILGITWLCVGVIEVMFALIKRNKEKKSKQFPVCI